MTSPQRPLAMTALAQKMIAEVTQPGDIAIDATVGNGLDTFFLAEQVGPGGHVIGFDIQDIALHRANLVLGEAGLLARVSLIPSGHEHLLAHLPETWPGEVRAIMFNLGYLPRGDKSIITRPETTLPALRDACSCLCPGGRMTVVLYPGHTGGDDEAHAAEAWARDLNQLDYETELIASPNATPTAPRLLTVTRR